MEGVGLDMLKEWTKTVGYREVAVEGYRGRHRPRRTWDEVIRDDHKIKKCRGSGQSKMEVCYQVNPFNPC